MSTENPPLSEEAIGQLFVAFDERMQKLESAAAEQERMHIELRKAVQEIIDVFTAAKGFLKVIEFLGKLARPLLWVGLLGGLFVGLYKSIANTHVAKAIIDAIK